MTFARTATRQNPLSRTVPCLTIERDKLLRMLGTDRLAGFRQAEEWMKSADVSIRRKAVVVLGDIADPVARERLETLAFDTDSSVADAARRMLQK